MSGVRGQEKRKGWSKSTDSSLWDVRQSTMGRVEVVGSKQVRQEWNGACGSDGRAENNICIRMKDLPLHSIALIGGSMGNEGVEYSFVQYYISMTQV